MGKLSDVIKHAGEFSEETDDEDLWEDEEPETDDDDFREDKEPEADDEDSRDGEEDAAERIEDDSRGRKPNQNISEGVVSGADSGRKSEMISAAGRAEKPYNCASENMVVPAEKKDSGQTGSKELDRKSFQTGGTETSNQENPQSEDGAEPECNEEGIPLKDILYAENIRRQGKGQFVVQSVYDRKIIRDMLFRHAYLSTGGYCGLLISFCSIGAAIYTYGRVQVWISFVLLLAGCIFTVIEPFLLRDRAKQMTRKGGIYYMPILFVLTPYGIELTRNGNHASHDWGDITRVTTTKYAVVMYKGRHTALVMTKRGIGDQKERLYAMIRKCARNAKYMKLK